MVNLITDHIDIWTAAQTQKKNGGRGRGKNSNRKNSHGIQKLRELILELAVRGKLVPQDLNDEPASVLLENIAKEKKRLFKEGKIKKQEKLPEISEDETPFKLPESWEWTRLGSISQINPRNVAEDNITTSFIPMHLISTSHTGEHGQEIKTWGEIKKGYTHFADGDIGVAKITPCFENSKAVVLSGLENGIGAGTTELHIARPYDSTLVPRYILLFLKAPMFLYLGETKMTGTAGQKRIPKAFFSETPLPLPPLSEQHRIVAKVDELMALCDQLEHQQTDSNATHETLVETLLAALTKVPDQDEFAKTWQQIADHFDALFTTEQSVDQLKQTILQLAVMGKLVPQDPNDEPASMLLEKIAVEKAQLISDKKIKKKRSTDTIISENCNWSCPSSWSESELQDLFKFIDYRGKNPKKSDKGKRLITAKNIRMGFIKDEPVEFISDELYDNWMVRGFPQNGDILFVTEGHTMGFVTLIDLKYEFALAQRTICFQSYIKLNTKFFLYALMSQQFQNIVRDNQTGSAAGGIKASKLKKIPIPVPPLAEQRRIVAKVDELVALCDTLKDRLNDTQTTQVQLADAMIEKVVA